MIIIPDITISQFWPLLISGDSGTLTELFAGEPLIDDPRAGRVAGEGPLASYVAASSTWLTRHHAHVETGPTTVTPFHAVAETLLHLQYAATAIILPVVIVADRAPTGGLAYLRVSHSLWPLHHRHVARPALLPGWTTLQLPKVVAAYREALASADVATIVRQFQATGYVREPAGVAFTHHGADELRSFYTTVMATGGVELEPCMLIDDSERCVLEYNVTRWGRRRPQPQPGVAVFERGGSELLQAVRLYDDIELQLPGATE